MEIHGTLHHVPRFFNGPLIEMCGYVLLGKVCKCRPGRLDVSKGDVETLANYVALPSLASQLGVGSDAHDAPILPLAVVKKVAEIE